jgi:hypothetical protein
VSALYIEKMSISRELKPKTWLVPAGSTQDSAGVPRLAAQSRTHRGLLTPRQSPDGPDPDRDPTELNRQGPDVGTQYRSTIFPTSVEQTDIAEAYIAQLNREHVFNAPVVTKIEAGRDFYPAEDYHQDFLTRNPMYPYIVANDMPKIENLRRLFPDLYRATPVLVAAAAPRS